jgi:hypothetical protein
MFEAEFMSVAVDQILRVVSQRKLFTELRLPTSLRALRGLECIPWG